MVNIKINCVVVVNVWKTSIVEQFRLKVTRSLFDLILIFPVGFHVILKCIPCEKVEKLHQN